MQYQTCWQHLTECKYDPDFLKKEFLAAAEKLDVLEAPATPEPRSSTTDRSVAFLHVQYHPFQIQRKDIQSVFRRECAETLRNASSEQDESHKLGIKRLIVAQSRAPNLRDRLCSARLTLPEGDRASDLVRHLQGKE